MKAPLSDEKGLALVTAMIFVFFLFTGTSAYLGLFLSEKRTLIAARHDLQAEALAEAGVELALWEYEHGGADFAGWTPSGSDMTLNAALTDTFGNAMGNYSVTVSDWSGSTPVISSTGTTAGDLNGAATQAVVKAAMQNVGLAAAAIKSNLKVHFDSNAYTDSYDSSDGQYGGANVGTNGDVMTNSTSSGSGAAAAISLDSNTHIYGDAATGASGTVSPESRVDGDVSHDFSEAFEGVDTLYASEIATLSALSNGGAVTLGTQTISTNRRYTSIRTNSNTTITISGNVSILLETTGTAMDLDSNTAIRVTPGSSLKIYTRGAIHTDSNVVIQSSANANNPNSSPQGLNTSAVSIFGLPTCTSIDFDSNVNLAGFIYAPSATVHLDSNVDIYGAIIGNQVDLDSNVGVHYDEYLSLTGPSAGRELSWVRRSD